MIKYEYFKNVEKDAIFTEEKCQFCGSKNNCLEGVYFERPNLKSVCLSCFQKKVIAVDIPQYLRIRVHDNMEKINKLGYTPPVPWVQYNDWQVCCDDFMQYQGEWTQEDFIRESNDGNGIEYFKSLLDEDFIKQINDIDILFNDLGDDTVAFVFSCRVCDKKKVVCQSY